MCYDPLFVRVVQRFDQDTGEFKNVIKMCKDSYEDYDYTLPCCKCAECLFQKSVEWSFRIMLESKAYKRSCFITLTYKDNPVSLNKRDYQLFLKRFRKKYGSHRYFMCGEYGSKGKRPHYHMIIFGFWPEDAKKPLPKSKYYGSEELESLWDKGFISVGELTQYDAKYCAKYMQKLQCMPPEFVQPFVSMSLKPGLGLNYFKAHMNEIVSCDKIYYNGDYIKIPKYFLSKVLQENPDMLADYLHLKEVRQKKAELIPNTFENLEKQREKYKKLLT